ncbi:toll/interleukin-1 receptor domain-containing protein [Actinokineospora sp. NBRC 105648]|uniref:toll/interleukin-1 receptor domain-containing protein n=1 Tax=Actinokineospora sp. NBRC 105648 TaxID=3032206 RepID=UPI0024A19C11|nr:toll/interleukin-1 receptor domain-containing protein [Actinokineospora sp. NBRC 105648]GLZ42334.1 hypothetical protein Acsp05_59580 [Actinokineospora sp. NBRC 105648]
MSAAESEVTAAAEYLAPRATSLGTGARVVADVAGLTMSALRVDEDVRVVRRLTDRDLAAGEPDPDCRGVVRRSEVNPPDRTFVLFDGVPLTPLPDFSTDLDTISGATAVNRVLRPLRLEIPVPVADPPRVFVNYRGGDDKIAAVLLDQGFVDRLGPEAVFLGDRSMSPGTPFVDVLLDRVRTARVLVVVVGEKWESVAKNGRRRLDDPDDWVRREILVAFERGLTVVPVLVGARERLSAAKLPPALAPLAVLQHAHLPFGFAHYPESIARVVDRVIRDTPGLAGD